MKVKCPSCKGVYHETTKLFDPNVPPNGAMVELLSPWEEWGWGKFGDARVGGAEVLRSEMLCPNCASPLAPDGVLFVMPVNYDKSLGEMAVQQIAAMWRGKAGPPLPHKEPEAQEEIPTGPSSGAGADDETPELKLRKSDLIRAQIARGRKHSEIAVMFDVSKQYVSKLAKKREVNHGHR